MKSKNSIVLLALTIGLAGPAAAATNILQYGFDATSGNVAVPVNDDSGAGHHGTHLLFGAAPTYSADIPDASKRQFTTGVGSVDFTSTTASITTANSAGVGSGQGIVTGAEIFTAGGLTMEVWVKNPAGAAGLDTCALNLGGTYSLGIKDGWLKFYGWSNDVDMAALQTNAFTAGEWNHIAAVLADPNAGASSYNTVSFYLNGELVASKPIDFFGSPLGRAASVGNHQYGEWANHDGLIYDPRVTLGALAPGQFTYIPEPASMTLLALGGMSLMSRRRRPA